MDINLTIQKQKHNGLPSIPTPPVERPNPEVVADAKAAHFHRRI